MRIYRPAFELTRKNNNRDREIDNVSDCGQYDMRTFSKEI